MPETVVLSARVSRDFRKEVDALAKALDRDRAWIVEQAVRRYLEEERQFITTIDQGRADIRAGRFVAHEDIEADLDRIETDLGIHK